MIPAAWMPHRRADGGVVGAVREAGDGFQPMDLLGRPLAEPGDGLAAEELPTPTDALRPAPPLTEWPG